MEEFWFSCILRQIIFVCITNAQNDMIIAYNVAYTAYNGNGCFVLQLPCNELTDVSLTEWNRLDSFEEKGC